MADTDGRKLRDLRVIDLRTELEKRGLDKNGVKVVLLDRLERALQDEGKDPETYFFDPLAMEKRSPVKRNSRSGSNAENENDEGVEDVNVDEMVIKDEVIDDDVETDKDTSVNSVKEDPVRVKEEQAVDEWAETAPTKKREAGEAKEAPAAKKVCKAPESTEVAKRNSEINGLDTEDSINLDIGEDELLNEESGGKPKATKDGSSGAEEQHGDAEQPQASKEQDSASAPADPAGSSTKQEARSDTNNTSDNKNSSGTAEGDKGNDEKTDTKKSSSSSSSSRNLWVSGLSGATRAKDLKQLCSKHGKVVGAKVVTNARTPGSRCYGYVTMVSSQDADSCIKHLHRTELHGRMISVEKAKSELGAGGWTGGSWPGGRSGGRERHHERTKEEQPKEECKEVEKDVKKEGEADKDRREHSKSKTADDSRKRIRERSGRRERSPRRGPPVRDVLTFSKIRKERAVQRERERLRRARSEERRRRVAEQVLREQERRQRVEKQRLALEREKLRIERERIDREKNELHRIERERQRLEREKLEFERLELKRAQMKLEEERRTKRGGYQYTSGSSPPWSKQGAVVYDSRGAPTKRLGFGGSAPVPPPPHFADTPPSASVAPPGSDTRGDRDRDRRGEYPRHPLGGGIGTMKYPSNGSSYDSRQPLPPGTRPRDQRYEGGLERGSSGTGSRGDRYGGGSGDGGHRSPKPPSRDHRYPDSTSSAKGDYDRQGSGWHSTNSSSATKGSFPSAPPSWNKPGGGASGAERYTTGSNYSAEGGRYAMHQPAPPGSQPPSFPEQRYTSQRDYRKY